MADDLDSIKGIGKATATRLVEAGIHTFAGLAAIDEEQAAALDVKPAWIEEARRRLDGRGGDEDEEPASLIRITAKTEGFRRCGIAHSRQPTDWPADHFSDEDLARLRAEPRLTVEFV